MAAIRPAHGYKYLHLKHIHTSARWRSPNYASTMSSRLIQLKNNIGNRYDPHKVHLINHTNRGFNAGISRNASDDSSQHRNFFQDKEKWKYFLLFSTLVGYSVCHYYFYKKYSKKSSDEIVNSELKNLDTYIDPYMSKDAKMIYYKNTWIPYQMLTKDTDFNAVETFSVAENDIFVASFPKSGQ